MKSIILLSNRGILWAILAIAMLFSPACSRQTARLDELDFRDPLVGKAQSKVREGDKDGAINCLVKALDRRPDLAQAHLELALLYDDYRKDYIKAIYHYQRYLELRPAAQKRELIEDLIRKAKISLAASLSEQFPEAAKKTQALEEENTRLKASLREVRENLAKNLKNEGGARESSEAAGQTTFSQRSRNDPVLPGQTVEPTTNSYCVRAGDTLSSIAAKVYHNPRKWKAILEANSAQLPSPDRLRSGQVLTIPK